MPYAAIASGVIGGLGKIYSDHRAGRQARKGRREYRSAMDQIIQAMQGDVQGQREDIARFLEPDVHRNYMQTAEAQSVMESARGNLQNLAQQIRGGVARSGGTTEAAVAGQGAASAGYADILNRLAGHGTQYKQQAQRTLMSALQGYRGAQQGVHQAQGQMATNIFNQRQQMAAGHAQAGQNWLESLLALGGTFNQN